MGRVMGQEPDDPSKVKLLFTVDELQELLGLISELPYNKSFKMIHKIMDEGGPQAEKIMGDNNE